MIREEAIENLKELLECSYVDSFEDTENEALEMAIENIEKIKRIEQLLNELSCDEMSNNELIDRIEHSTLKEIKDKAWKWYCFLSDVCNIVNM